MEKFFDFGSENLKMKLPTSFELNEIKQMLLTGERNQILLSVEKIKTFLNAEKSVSEILRSDILKFLCDAILPYDYVVACALYQCIEVMVTHLEFFIHNHSCFVIESLLRISHFLLKDCDNFRGLSQCLNLLNLILEGYKFHGMTPEKKTIENLFELLSVLKNLSPTVNNQYQTGVLIFNLFELKLLKWSQQGCNTILASSSSWFSLLNEISKSDHPMREKLVILGCMLSNSILRYFLSDENSMKEYKFDIIENLKNHIIKNISDFLITLGAPFFDSIPCNELEKNLPHLEDFYQTILWLYSDEIAPQKTRFVHGLSERGFLQFTTKLLFFVGLRQEQKLHRLCVHALFYMIFYLSEDVFHFPEVWPSGRDDFRYKVLHGIAELPSDATQWLNVLVNPHSSFSSKLTFLLFFYFYSMTARSQDMLPALYPALASYIRFGIEIRSSALLLKVVWFLFVMSQMSVVQSSSLETEVEDTKEMVALLEAQQDLSLVYTHHPALLYWAFSSKVSSNIQTQTVYLWLKNKTSNCTELDELISNSSDVKQAILGILQNGRGQELDYAFSCLKSYLLGSSTDDDLAVSIWFLLPQVLAKFTADFTSVMNVDYIVELSSLKTPKSLDPSKMIQIASLLPEVLLKSDLISIIPSLSLVFQLVRLGRQTKDKRALWVFLRHNGFVQKIIEGLNTNVSEICILSIKIIVVMWKECQDVKNIECIKIKINREDILKMVNSNCDQVLSEGLSFFEKILLSNFDSPIFEIPGIDDSFLKLLFMEIQNACIKTNFDNCKRIWRCLKFFLVREPLGVELVTDPLLGELVVFSLPHLKESRELQELLEVWMNFYNAKVGDPCFERKIFGELYLETLMRIGRELTEAEKQEDPALLKKGDRGHKGHSGRMEKCIYGRRRISLDLLWKCSPDFVRKLIQTLETLFPVKLNELFEIAKCVGS